MLSAHPSFRSKICLKSAISALNKHTACFSDHKGKCTPFDMLENHTWTPPLLWKKNSLDWIGSLCVIFRRLQTRPPRNWFYSHLRDPTSMYILTLHFDMYNNNYVLSLHYISCSAIISDLSLATSQNAFSGVESIWRWVLCFLERAWFDPIAPTWTIQQKWQKLNFLSDVWFHMKWNVLEKNKRLGSRER